MKARDLASQPCGLYINPQTSRIFQEPLSNATPSGSCGHGDFLAGVRGLSQVLAHSERGGYSFWLNGKDEGPKHLQLAVVQGILVP